MNDKLIGAKALAAALGCCVRQVWKLRESERLPRPVRLGRSVKWRESDIDRFIEADCDMRRFEAERNHKHKPQQ
ncbi:MAG: helix-turn-helix transcriptional regulator [Dehalococcoidia bacterium]